MTEGYDRDEMSRDPVDRFVASGGPTPDASQHAVLAAALEQAYDAGCTAWPSVELDRDRFFDHLAARLADARDPVAALQRRNAADLYLACACAHGRTDAISTFEKAFATTLRRALAIGRARGIDEADLRQRFFERILVTTDGSPARIASYTGEGSLAAWVRVVATRISVDADRRRWELETSLGPADDGRRDPIAADPELALLRARVKAPFVDAFAAALGELTPRQRNLLRLSILRGKSGTAIAQVFGISRATAKRWLASARTELLQRTRAHLKHALAVDTVELEHLLQLAESKLEVSVGGLLGHSSEIDARDQ